MWSNAFASSPGSRRRAEPAWGGMLQPNMDGPRRNRVVAIVLLASLVYPAAVYFGRSAIPPLTFVAVARPLLIVRAGCLGVAAAPHQRGLLFVSGLARSVLARAAHRL